MNKEVKVKGDRIQLARRRGCTKKRGGEKTAHSQMNNAGETPVDYEGAEINRLNITGSKI